MDERADRNFLLISAAVLFCITLCASNHGVLDYVAANRCRLERSTVKSVPEESKTKRKRTIEAVVEEVEQGNTRQDVVVLAHEHYSIVVLTGSDRDRSER